MVKYLCDKIDSIAQTYYAVHPENHAVIGALLCFLLIIMMADFT